MAEGGGVEGMGEVVHFLCVKRERSQILGPETAIFPCFFFLLRKKERYLLPFPHQDNRAFLFYVLTPLLNLLPSPPLHPPSCLSLCLFASVHCVHLVYVFVFNGGPTSVKNHSRNMRKKQSVSDYFCTRSCSIKIKCQFSISVA